ncbi:hypothetical protein MBLNU230_g2753t1 [Neophaeotheca triangularis]
MKVATLQFSPVLGDFKANIARANAILEASKPSKLDLIVLPELAFTGYNFSSLEHIEPHLEPTSSGPTTEWATSTAQRYKCYVTVGYPEKTTPDETGTSKNYNALVTVSPAGEITAHYRKSFLYYTDETWAAEGDSSFYNGTLNSLGNVSMGICMDINPYRFTAPWTAYEFATHCVKKQTNLVVLSMAWLTRLLPEELMKEPRQPDMTTVAYWLERFYPFTVEPEGDVTIVFANRTGIEGEPGYVSETGSASLMLEGNQVCYAGSSCVMQIRHGQVHIFDMLGKGEERLLVVDTLQPPKYALQQRAN